MSKSLDKYKLSTELHGHSLDVRAVASGYMTAENGQTIISGSRDKTAKIWQNCGDGTNTYRDVMTFQDHKNFVSSVVYLEREGWICTGSNDYSICIYAQGSYVPIIKLKEHTGTVCSIAGGLELQTLISGSWDKTARIWQIDQLGNARSIVLQGHDSAVWSVVTMKNARNYITASADKNIIYWNERGEKLRILKGHTDCVRALIALPNNTLLSAANDGTIRHWNEDGECVQTLYGHSNYIYSLAMLSEDVIVSGGEDSTLRMWSLTAGTQLGEPIMLPTQSVWSVACLANGDIIVGSSDGIVRVFTSDPARRANEVVLTAYQIAIEAHKQQISEELGGIKKTDLPGPESLYNKGTREGQTKMVRHPDGSVKCYSWDLGKWNLVGDVTGASGGSQKSSGKALHEGKEYDYVFSVDISDNAAPLKLPYNRSEDPWHVAQTFIHKNNLPQVYLDEVANFIIKNSGGGASVTASTTGGFQDPFTGGSRYVPGSSNTGITAGGNVDPFTGASSYSTGNGTTPSHVDVQFKKGSDKHFPVTIYITFDVRDPNKILNKLREFNNSFEEPLPDDFLDAVIKLADDEPEVDKTAVEALMMLMYWPKDKLFPVIDITRLAVRNEKLCTLLCEQNFLDSLLPCYNESAANQLMIIRCLANMLCHPTGRYEVYRHLNAVVLKIDNTHTGTANLQIAIATFLLNVTIAEIQGKANKKTCLLITGSIVHLLLWANDLEACYRAFQGLGNLTTTPFVTDATAMVISCDVVMDKIREITNTPQTGAFAKLNSVGNALLAAF